MIHSRRLLLQPHQPIHGHLRRPHAILDREDNVVRDLDELAHKREVGAPVRDDGGPVAFTAGKELCGYVGHETGDGGGVFEGGV